jgi:hypothetical protein
MRGGPPIQSELEFPVEREDDQNRTHEDVVQGSGDYIDEPGLEGQSQGFPVIDLQPLAVVDEQEDAHDEDAEFGTLSEGDDQRKDHEDAELAQHIGRCRRCAGTTDPVFLQQDGHRQPQDQEIAQEQRDTLAAEARLDSGQRLFPRRVGSLRIQVQARNEEGIARRPEKPGNEILRLFFIYCPVIKFQVLLHSQLRVPRRFHQRISEGIPALAGLDDGGQEGEDGIEHQQRRERRQVLLVLPALDIVPHQIAGPQDEVDDRPLGILVQERDYRLARANIQVLAPLPFLARLPVLARLPPGDVSQLIVNPDQAPIRLLPLE